MAKTNFLKLSREAYEAAVTFADANYRPDWDYSIKAFRGEHASGSKYLAPEYASRSRLFRPKTRSVIRKNEAAGAAALFSNMEIVDLQPGDPDNPMSVAARDAMKALLEYRLGKTIPTFEICMGGIQDAQVQGAVCSYQYWEYLRDRKGRIVKDKPCIELRPIENIGLDGGASWLDPVNTSPYFYDVIPMPVCEVRAMMESTDDKTGAPKWKKFDDKTILRATPDVMDSTRRARFGKQQDPHQEKTGIGAYDTVWVIRWFMRDHLNDDYTFYTLGNEELLTVPQPLEEVYFHGLRPYEMGYAVLETHKVMKTSVPMLVKPLQQEMNEIANQRIDNVKFVLNKRWLVARGRQADVQSLVRNVAGGVTLTTDPKTDIVESNWPDVTSSSYVEQDRLNADFDDVAGNFSPATKFANKGTNDTLGGVRMASQGAGMMTDYLLRTIIETWWEKVLRQVIKLEAAYETDEKVLALCAKKAQLFPRYSISRISDEMLNDEVSLTVNVGMGSTNPAERFQKLITGWNAVMDTVMKAPPNFNASEFVKEAASNMGYRDGSRFWSDKADPRLSKAMQMIQQLQGALESKKMEMQQTAQLEQQKLLSGERVEAAKLRVDYARIQGDLAIRQAEAQTERLKVLNDSQAEGDPAGEIDTAVSTAVERIQTLIAMHAQKMNNLLEVDRVKEDAKRQVAQAKSEAAQADGEKKATEQRAADTAKRDNDRAVKMEKANKALMDGVERIVAGLTELGKQKKTIALIKKDGQTVGAEVS